VLGVSRSGAALTVLKKRVEKRNEAGWTLRVLGAFIARDLENTEKPSVVLAVGHSAIDHADTSEMVPVVCRQSNAWDGIEKEYVHSLNATNVLSSELPLLFAVDGESDSEGEVNDAPVHQAFSNT
jgi:hypothetical protein